MVLRDREMGKEDEQSSTFWAMQARRASRAARHLSRSQLDSAAQFSSASASSAHTGFGVVVVVESMPIQATDQPQTGKAKHRARPPERERERGSTVCRGFASQSRRRVVFQGRSKQRRGWSGGGGGGERKETKPAAAGGRCWDQKAKALDSSPFSGPGLGLTHIGPIQNHPAH